MQLIFIQSIFVAIGGVSFALQNQMTVTVGARQGSCRLVHAANA